jgi:biopolymer transport protein ExbB
MERWRFEDPRATDMWMANRRGIAFTSIVLGCLLLLPGPRPILAQESGRAAAESADPGRGKETKSFFWWMYEASGPIGLVILVMSFYLIALVAWMAMEYRRTVALPDRLLRDLNDLLTLKQYTEAYQRVSESNSFLGRVLAAGVRKLPSGLGPAQRAMELANDDATMAMEHRTTYLATVGTLGPMIGLVGTIWGMILSFQEIATAAGAQPRPEKVAEGISTALFITLEGVSLSVPAIFFFALFRNRIAQMTMEANRVADRTINSLVVAAKAGKAS